MALVSVEGNAKRLAMTGTFLRARSGWIQPGMVAGVSLVTARRH